MNKIFPLIFAILPLWLYVPLIKPYLKNNIIICGVSAGILAGCGVLLFKLSFLQGTIKPPSQETLTLTLFISFIEAGLLEEVFKNSFYMIAEKYLKNKNANLSPFNHFALGALTGLGFGVLENIYYAFTPEFGEVDIIFSRIYTSILAHIIMNASFGFLRGQKIGFIYALLISILIHAIYDFFALPSTLLGSILVRVFLVIGLGFCLFMGKKSFKQSEQYFQSLQN